MSVENYSEEKKNQLIEKLRLAIDQCLKIIGEEIILFGLPNPSPISGKFKNHLKNDRELPFVEIIFLRGTNCESLIRNCIFFNCIIIFLYFKLITFKRSLSNLFIKLIFVEELIVKSNYLY